MSEETNHFSQKAISPLLAGLTAGSVSTALLLPLDNIKVRLQVQEGYVGLSKGAAKHSRHLGGSIRLVRGVVRHEGLRGLYQGLTPAVLGSAVSWGGFFFVYEGLKRELKHLYKSSSPDADVTLTPWDNFKLASLSGAVMVCLTNPVWLIKTRMQLQMKQASEQLKSGHQPYNGMIDAGKTIIREEGLWALYKGAGPALLLTSHGGVQFVVYEYLREHFHFARAQRESEGHISSVLERLEKSLGYLTMGASAKIVASTITYPLQVAKSRMQQRSEFVELTSDGDVRVVKRRYLGFLVTMRRIWTKEGMAGFFRGCIPNAVRVAPSAAVTFVVYEAVLDFLLSSA